MLNLLVLKQNKTWSTLPGRWGCQEGVKKASNEEKVSGHLNAYVFCFSFSFSPAICLILESESQQEIMEDHWLSKFLSSLSSSNEFALSVAFYRALQKHVIVCRPLELCGFQTPHFIFYIHFFSRIRSAKIALLLFLMPKLASGTIGHTERNACVWLFRESPLCALGRGGSDRICSRDSLRKCPLFWLKPNEATDFCTDFLCRCLSAFLLFFQLEFLVSNCQIPSRDVGTKRATQSM